MSVANEIFESGFDLYKFLTDKSRSKNILAKMLYREIRDNLERLELRNKSGVNRQRLIEMLSNESYVNAVKNNFRFSRMAKGQTIDKHLTNKIPALEKYRGWNAEQLLNSIDGKIVALKDLLKLFDDIDNAGVNLTARLNNLNVQLLAVSILIKYAN